jgi:hypothetical protein
MLRFPIRPLARVALRAVPPAALAAQPQSAAVRDVVRGREVLTLEVPVLLAEAEPLRAAIAAGRP